MLTVACVLRSGGVYDAGWVARLRDGVGRHLARPHRFVCLSDCGVPCERIPLRHDWPGWWAKLEAFRPDILGGSALFLDLDTLVVGDLEPLAQEIERSAFIALRDFYRPDGLGSGVMAWRDQGKVSNLYRLFAEDAAEWMARLGARGDQGFLEEIGWGAWTTRLQAALPGFAVSYKADRCDKGVPLGAGLLCFHGKPKQADFPADHWIRKAWDGCA